MMSCFEIFHSINTMASKEAAHPEPTPESHAPAHGGNRLRRGGVFWTRQFAFNPAPRARSQEVENRG